MAETTVTGRIGDQDVNLINAASEVTLIKVLEAVNRMAAASGGNGTQTAAKAKKLADEAVKNQTDLNKEVKDSTDNIKDHTKTTHKFAESIGAAAFQVDSWVRTFSKGVEDIFSGATPTVKSFTGLFEKLPVVGGVIGSFGRILDDQIQVFRNLSGVGIDLGNSLFSAQKSAARAGLPLDVFAKTLQENASALALFGGSATAGAQKFTEIAAQMKKNGANAALGRLGFSMDEISSYTASYIEQQTRLGKAQKMTQAELTAGAEEYNMQLDLLSRATGIQRKELDEANKRMMADKRMRNAMSQLRGAEGQAITAMISKLEQVDPQNAQGIKDLIAAGGVPLTEQARMVALASPEMVQFAKNVANGTATASDFSDKIRTTAKRADSMSDSAKRLGQITLTTGQQTQYGALMGFQGLQDFTSGLDKAKEAQAEAVNENKKSAATLDQSLTTIKTAFANAFINTGILDKMAVGIASVVTALGNFISDIMTFDLSTAIANLFDPKGANNTTNEKGEAVKGSRGVFDAIGSVLAAGITSLFENPTTYAYLGGAIVALFGAAIVKKALVDSLSNIVGNAASKLTVGKAASTVAKQPEATGAFGKAAGSGLSAMLKGLASGAAALANPATLIGLGAITLAVMGLAKAFEIASRGFEPFGEMVKRILEGLDPVIRAFGAAFSEVIQGIGTAISNAKEGIEAVFAGISTIIKTIGDTIIGSINAIAGGIGVVIDKITAFKTAGIAATTDQIERLSAIPSENMTRAAEGIAAMKAALDGFEPGFIKGISTGLGSLFGGDQATSLSKMAALGPELDSASVGFSRFKEALNGLNFATLTFSSDQLDSLQNGSVSLKKMSEQLMSTADTLEKFGARDPFKYLANVGNIAPGLNTAADSVNNFKSAAEGFTLTDFTFSGEQLDNLTVGTKKLSDLAVQVSNSADAFRKLDNTGLNKIKEGVEGLSKAFKDFNTSFIDQFIPKFESLKAQSPEQAISGLGSKLDQLNSNITNLVGIQEDAKKNLDTIASKSGDNMLKRR